MRYVLPLFILFLSGCGDSARSARYAQVSVEAANRTIVLAREELRKPDHDLAKVDQSLESSSQLLATASLSLGPVVSTLDSLSFFSTTIPDTVDTALEDVPGFNRRATLQAGKAEAEASRVRLGRNLLNGAVASAGASLGPIGSLVVSGGGALAMALAAFAAKRTGTLKTALDMAVNYGKRVADAPDEAAVEKIKAEELTKQAKAGVLNEVRDSLGKS
jgi:hypothetical protein